MAGLGFAPTGQIDARYVEYYKDYAEPHGRVARCTILIGKNGPISMWENAHVENFIVTVQGQIAPMPDEVKNSAPRVMHADMLTVLERLEGMTLVDRKQSVELRTCSECHETVSEWLSPADLNGEPRVVCINCLTDMHR